MRTGYVLSCWMLLTVAIAPLLEGKPSRGGGGRGSRGGGGRGSRGGGGRGGRSHGSRIGFRYHSSGSRHKHYSGGRSYSHRSSVSKTKYKYVFPTSHSLSHVYISPAMGPHIHLHNYRDLYGYTVCKGVNIIRENGTEVNRTYTHFICPDHPLEVRETECCYYDGSDQGFCCRRSGMPAWASVSIAIAAFLFLVLTCRGICCCRKRCKKAPSSAAQVELTSVKETVKEGSSSSSSSESDDELPPGAGNEMPPLPTDLVPPFPPPPYPDDSNRPPYPPDQQTPLLPYTKS